MILNNARLDGDLNIVNIDVKNLIHLRHVQNNAALDGNRAARKSGSCAARRDGNHMLIGVRQNLRYFRRCFRKNDRVGTTFDLRAVARITAKLGGCGGDMLSAYFLKLFIMVHRTTDKIECKLIVQNRHHNAV